MNYKERNQFVHSLLNMGKALLKCGAEIYRVEDTLYRMANAYGALETNIFVIPSTIVITLKFEDGDIITQSKRIYRACKNDFTKLEELNALSRDFCGNIIGANELDERIKDIYANNQRRLYGLLGNVIAASMFTIFFGGNFFDAAIAGIVGLLIWIMQEHLAAICMNDIVFTFVASIISGLAICILGRIVPLLHIDKIMIGDIMLLIPGVLATNGIRDILLRDTLSGLIRIIEALLLAGALALGFMISIAIVENGIWSL